MGNFLDLTNQKFGRLKVNKLFSIEKGIVRWLCQCECGKETIVLMGHLRDGHTQSCGCYMRERAKQANIIHGFTNTRFYFIYKNMVRRILDKNSTKYPIYGARGIKINNRWLKFENFKNDMYESYLGHIKQFGRKNTTIERKNVNGNYELSNCKWATYKEQANNKRNNHLLTFNGQTLTISQWATKINISLDTLNSRILLYKWPIEKALTFPVRKRIKSS